MNLKEQIINYIQSNFDSDEYSIEEFESGCAIIDLYPAKNVVTIVIQAEPTRIGISKYESNELDFSLPDETFYTIDDSIVFINKLIQL